MERGRSGARSSLGWIAGACVLYLVVALATAPDYGITWDEALHGWYVGERSLDHLLAGGTGPFELRAGDAAELETGHPRTRLLTEPEHVQYLGNLLSAIGCRVFYTGLGVLGSVEAHHVPNFLLVAGVLAAMFAFLRSRFGALAATLAAFCIAAQPRFWANTHFNTKDVPYACLMTFTLLAARKALLERSAAWTCAAALLLGLAAATKPNAALIPLIVGAWWLFARAEGDAAPRRPRSTGFVAALVFSPVLAWIGFAALWPQLWQNPVGFLASFVGHYASLAGGGEPGVQWSTLLLFAAVQPPAVLLFGGIGIGVAVAHIAAGRGLREPSALLVVWLALPLVRVALPHVLNFDGVRHFLGATVPLGALAGIGAARAFGWLGDLGARIAPSRPWVSAVAASLVALPFLGWLHGMVALHPHQVAYFNFLVGGTRGAQTRWPHATDYWGSSYREGIRWLNANAEPGAHVVVPIGGHIVGSVRHLWLRDDLRLLLGAQQGVGERDFARAVAAARPGPLYAMYVTRADGTNRLVRSIDASWEPRHTLFADGAPILKIASTDLGGGVDAPSGPAPKAAGPARRPCRLDPSDPAVPVTAKRENFRMLCLESRARRGARDGSGTARIDWGDGGPAPVPAGSSRQWTIVYEAAGEGLDVGGAIRFGVPRYWKWTPPQTASPEGAGHVRADTEAPGVGLAVRARTDTELSRYQVEIEISGRPLAPGERVRIVYGAGAEKARVDPFAERDTYFPIEVDGDGDGVFARIAELPRFDVAPRDPARLLLTLPTTARPGEPVSLRVAVLDLYGNGGLPVTTTVELIDRMPGIGGPAKIALSPADRGTGSADLVFEREGVFRVRGRTIHGISAESNPLVVSRDAPRVLWGDLHGHSNLTDGSGTPEQYFRYARDVAALDLAALTDHDHWGLFYLDQRPDLWAEIRRQTRAFHAPGTFVTLLGYEWTSWIHGHRHVLYFDDDGPVLSSFDPRTDDPPELWSALRGRRALTFAHHSAGGSVATNWAFPPDPELEPLTEIVSNQGSSEAADSPGRIRDSVAGRFVRDLLDRGNRVGFVGSGDTHSGHPGVGSSARGHGGLAAVLSEDLTREAVLEALRARRVYATNGTRLALDVDLDGHPMGAVLSPSESAALRIRVAAPSAVDRIEIIRSGEIHATHRGRLGREVSWRPELLRLRAGEYVYVRVVLEDRGAAWSSPFFFE